MKRTISSVLLLFTLCAFVFSGCGDLRAQNPDRLKEGREFLKLSHSDAKNRTKRMGAEEARALTSQIIQLSKARNPDLLHLNYLLEQLADLSATEKGERRLKNLLLVIMLTLGLFTGFLLFVFLDQKKAIRQLTAAADAGAYDSSPRSIRVSQSHDRLTSASSREKSTASKKHPGGRKPRKKR